MGWKQRNWWQIALSGVCAGLLPYRYIPARLAPFLFLFLGLSFIKHFGTFTWMRTRTELPRACVFTVVAGLVAAQILVCFPLHPETFLARGNEVSVVHASSSQRDPVTAFLVNSWEHLLEFGFVGDPNWRNNNAGRPLLNPEGTIFFWLGVGMAI